MPRPTPSPLTVVLTVVVGAIMVPVDGTIVNIAIYQLAESTGASLPVIQWVTTAYALALATVLPVSAWFIRRFGARTVFLTAVALFAAGSGLVAASWNVESLIVFRVVQGLAGGVVMPATMTLVLGSAPPDQRGRMMSLLGLPIMAGPILAPVLGGWLLDALSWRWMFLINLPIGLCAVLLGLRNLPRLGTGRPGPIDRKGLLLLPPALALLVLGTSRIRSDALPASAVMALAAGALLIIAFVVHARRAEAPLLEVRLLWTRLTGGSALVLFAYVGGTMAALILMPLYWQVARGFTALETGLFMAPAGVAAAATIRLSGRLIDTQRPRRVITAGIATATCAQLGLALAIALQAPAWTIAALWTLASVGSAFTVMPASTTATRDLAPTDVPSGTTLVQVTSQVAAAVGVAIVSLVLSGRLAEALPSSAGGVAGLARSAADLDRLAGAFASAWLVAAGLMAVAALAAAVVYRHTQAPPPTSAPADDTLPRTDEASTHLPGMAPGARATR